MSYNHFHNCFIVNKFLKILVHGEKRAWVGGSIYLALKFIQLTAKRIMFKNIIFACDPWIFKDLRFTCNNARKELLSKMCRYHFKMLFGVQLYIMFVNVRAKVVNVSVKFKFLLFPYLVYIYMTIFEV